ncbi:MAG: PP2C family protein-serine/threonine phosphatase [Eubacteriales bacterium]|nr:PP2C family protein-serine/threonine phosphatase [Eubacteriales bacterium]
MKVRFSIRKKSVLLILFIVILLTTGMTSISYNIYARTMDEHYRNLAMNVAKTTVSVVDHRQIQRYVEGVAEIYLQNPAPVWEDAGQEEAYLAEYDKIKDTEYQELYETLDGVKKANEVKSLYIIYVDPDSKTCVYIIDADQSETACPAGTWDIIYEQNYGVFQDPEGGFPAYITKTEEFGWLCSAGAAFVGTDGNVIAYAMVDIDMNQVMQDRHDYLRYQIFFLVIFILIVIFLAIRVINKTIINPINKLAGAASCYVKEKERGLSLKEESVFQKLDIHTGDELENLSTVFAQMEQDITVYIDNLVKATSEKERIGAELSVATDIQASMLPSIFPPFPDRDEFEIYASMNPAKEVGGDFYDFFLVDNDHLALVIADVSGKGVPASLFMVIAKTLIKNKALTGASPKEILETVNNQLCENNDAEMFVTVWLGIYEISTGKMTAANAGHEYPAIRRAGGAFELMKDRHGLVLAGMEGSRYREYDILLNVGDTIFVYTDGVPEATNSEEELYGTERMLQSLNKEPDASPEQLLKAVKEDIDIFNGEAPQFDDITMLAVKIKSI